MVQAYVPNVMDAIGAFEAGQQGGMARRKQEASRQIGGLMASGDYKGAAAAAYGAGDYGTGLQLEKLGSEQRASERRRGYGEQFAAGKGKDAVNQAYGAGDFEIAGELQKAIDAASESEKAMMKARATRIAQLVAPLGDIPDMAARKAYISQNAAALMEAGYTQEQLATFEPTDANLAPIYAEALGLKDYLEYRKGETKPDWKEQKNADGSTTWVDFNDRNAPQGAPAQQMAQSAAAPSNLDSVFDALIQQESGGRAGVRGPQTRYGVAEGMTQMLPATAQAMAQKLGVQWRPELMTGTSPQAAEYQRTLGRAYFEEGLQRYGGDVRKALAYYHGGPNEDIWGPKTRQYVDSVLARVSRQQAAAPRSEAEVLAGGSGNDEVRPYEVASVGETPPPPSPGGLRTRQGSAAPQQEWVDQPDGTQRNIRTGERKGDRSGAAGYTPKQLNEATLDIKSKFEGLPQVKAFRDVQASFKVINSISKKAEPTAADDLSLIFSYMKMLDPGSVVREGEFANAQNTAGVPDQIVNAYNRALSGKRLNPSQRREFANTAGQIVIDRRRLFDQTANEYRALAQDAGISPDRIAPAGGSWEKKSAAAPKMTQQQSQAALSEAREAIRRGADRSKVIERLRQAGVSTKGL